MNDFERGLLAAFCRTSLTAAQKTALLLNFPELGYLVGPLPVHGIPEVLFKQMEASCKAGNWIQSIKDLRSWAIETGGKTFDGANIHPLSSLKAAKDFVDQHFPRPKSSVDY